MLRQQRRDRFGAVLEIAVHCHDHVAAHEVERRAQCRLVAEVARQRHDDEPVVALSGLLEEGERAVPAPVVHEHDLVRATGNRVEHGAQPPQQLGHPRLLVVQRNRHGDSCRVAHRRARPLKYTMFHSVIPPAPSGYGSNTTGSKARVNSSRHASSGRG